MASENKSTLLRMPPEVMVLIAALVSFSDLSALRLTCKAIEAALFSSFAHEFFSKKQFMLCEASLQKLLQIANHATLGPSLRHVIIGSDSLFWEHGSGHEYSIFGIGYFSAQQSDLFAGQFNFQVTGRARQLLATAFAKLPNLETVDIRDFKFLNRNSTRPRTTPGPALVAADPLHRSNLRSMTDDRLSRVFTVVMAALTDVKARPSSIEVLTRRENGLWLFALFMPDWQRPSLEPLLANLKKLHLDVSIIKYNPAFDPDSAPTLQNLNSKDLQLFLSSCFNLMWLRLNFGTNDMGESVAFLKWLGTNASSVLEPTGAAGVPPINFPRLRRLDLGRMASVVPQHLLDVIIKFAPTLEHLSLRRVGLADSPTSQQAVHIDYEDDEDIEDEDINGQVEAEAETPGGGKAANAGLMWAAFFKHIRAKTSLRAIDLSLLRGSNYPDPVIHLSNGPAPESVSFRAHEGQSMDEFLLELAKFVKPKPVNKAPSGDEASSEEGADTGADMQDVDDEDDEDEVEPEEASENEDGAGADAEADADSDAEMEDAE